MELIPGLINEMAIECLIRVPFNVFPTISSVSRTWRHELHQPEFHRHRKSSGHTQPIIILTQSTTTSPHTPNQNNKTSSTSNNWLTTFSPESNTWTKLPSASPQYLQNGLPIFAGLAACGSNLAVIGGLDPVTWKVLNTLYIYNFLTGHWRRGPDMPGGERSLFGCAAGNNTLVVTGGHDKEKRALKSSLAYNFSTDTWTTLPEMSQERDECTVVYIGGGRFRVISGYETERQGWFTKTAEILDMNSWQWVTVEEEFTEVEGGDGLRCCVVGGDGEMYACQGRGGDTGTSTSTIKMWREGKWRVVTEVVVDELSWVHYIAVLEESNKLLVIGSSKNTVAADGVQTNVVWVYDMVKREWRKLVDDHDGHTDTGGEYNINGHVQAGCAIQL